MSLSPLPPLNIKNPIKPLITSSPVINQEINSSDINDNKPLPNNELSELETRLRLEFQQQFDQLKELIGNNSSSPIIKTNETTCPTDVKWDPIVDRCRSPDGKFVKSDCCDTDTQIKPEDNQEVVKSNQKECERKNPPSYYITLIMNKYMNEYILSSTFHKEVNELLVDNGIPIIINYFI